MKNRMSITPWSALRPQRTPLAETSHTMSVDLFGGANPVGLSETWRGWEAGISSEFLNRLMFTPHGRSSTGDTAVQEDWICFRDGGSELGDTTRATLGDRVKLLRASPAIRIVIGGLAGRVGTIALGVRLGLKRVASIRAFLLEAGIEPGRIGIAVRGSGWSVVERCGGSEEPTCQGGECRLQMTDPRWTLARN